LPVRKILVGVNGSHPSFNASNCAIELAKRNDSELIALHVIHPMYSQYEIALSPRPVRLKEVARKEMKEGQEYVDKVKQKGTEKKVSVKAEVIIGIT